MYYHIDLRIIVSAVWIFTTLVDGSPQLYVSTDVQYEENDVYFVNEGDDVDLTCEYPMDSLRVDIWKEDSNRNMVSLAVNGQLRTDLNREKYSLTVNSGRNVLTIHGVSITDSALYGCTVTTPVSCRQFRCLFESNSQTLSLDVVDDNVQNCTFVSNGIFGTYFNGDDIVLHCPTGDISLSIRNGPSAMINIPHNVVTEEEDDDNIHLIKIPSINTTFNGTKLVCMNMEKTIDLCENLTVITVYKELMATVTPNSVDVPDGGSTELTCLSNLHDVVSFEFDIQYTNATVGNVSMSEVPGGMKVTITEINFQLDVASSGLLVSCNVTFGTRYVFGNTTINLMKTLTPPIMIPNVSTTQQLPDIEATSIPRASDNKVIVIVLPIAIVLVIIGIVAAILLYCKSSRKGKPSLMQKNTSRQDEAKAANDQKMPDNDDYYLEPNNSKKVLSLDQTDDYYLEPNNGKKVLRLDQTDDYYLEPNNGKKVLSLDQTDDYYLEPNNGKKVLSLDQTDYEIVGNDAI